MDFHDYSIVGVDINREDNSLLLSLLDPEGNASDKLLISNVQKLFVDSFQMQNVILELKIFRGRDESFEFSRACELLDLQEGADDFFSQGMVLVFFEASVGAEIACLCESPPKLTRNKRDGGN